MLQMRWEHTGPRGTGRSLGLGRERTPKCYGGLKLAAAVTKNSANCRLREMAGTTLRRAGAPNHRYSSQDWQVAVLVMCHTARGTLPSVPQLCSRCILLSRRGAPTGGNCGQAASCAVSGQNQVPLCTFFGFTSV